MPGKKKRPPARLALQIAFAAYVEANVHVKKWTAKSLAYHGAGKLIQAQAAERHAARWLRKLKALEARAARGSKRANP
jgi:hypothetical protein